MSSNFPDLYAICKIHLADKSCGNESDDEFITWVTREYMIQIPPSHEVPSGFRSDFENEIRAQIEQWLRATIYGSTLQQFRSR